MFTDSEIENLYSCGNVILECKSPDHCGWTTLEIIETIRKHAKTTDDLKSMRRVGEAFLKDNRWYYIKPYINKCVKLSIHIDILQRQLLYTQNNMTTTLPTELVVQIVNYMAPLLQKRVVKNKRKRFR